MKKLSAFGLVAILSSSLLTTSAFANGLQEDRSWQFDSVNAKFLALNEELTRIKLENGGFTQVFNVTADGDSVVYVGNNTHTEFHEGSVQNNNTSIGNMTTINVGDGSSNNTITVGQNNQDSNQVAVGATIGTGGGNVGDFLAGLQLGGTP